MWKSQLLFCKHNCYLMTEFLVHYLVLLVIGKNVKTSRMAAITNPYPNFISYGTFTVREEYSFKHILKQKKYFKYIRK